ncbi:hypothetical protein CLAFUW4_02513 [Fulvia fulva]|uniref:Uncharacterized protein n=1 Tax=Passalora fulva TaxID=5499 RepID=A0A9Q8P5E1_PASFU|nr:uncharacterized protein CLAFUR5_02503 [Fulvia fulva]KAK4631702.1 hypothetical protein CLAFUR4_02508 [Fulvia fulva]KAK4633464.1 hypothetical protein CLAFUR0_02512 [Fulvia fulva]UJO14025.1 hypothetical protein CLAFUR5_02503 [Fulvia fulva]WPV11756.1 hypothetical protein CLAFUW4_02513 [Fulvia fulva]WPV25949.1 hypothetical protein CLAFUW7_02513 [Fulvia fulva]
MCSSFHPSEPKPHALLPPLQRHIMDDSAQTEQEVDPGATIAADNLEKLGSIIEEELKSWMIYLHSQSGAPSYEILTSDDKTDAATKIKCLRHILETLPTRHKALINAYNAAETEQVELADQCAVLLEQLQVAAEVPPNESKAAGDEDNKKLDLQGYYDQKLFRGKKFKADIAARLEELKELMTMFEELMIVREEGVLELKQVQLLVEAMDDVGLSASSALVGEESTQVKKARVVEDGEEE